MLHYLTGLDLKQNEFYTDYNRKIEMDKGWWDREVNLTGCSGTRKCSENRSSLHVTALHHGPEQVKGLHLCLQILSKSSIKMHLHQHD